MLYNLSHTCPMHHKMRNNLRSKIILHQEWPNFNVKINWTNNIVGLEKMAIHNLKETITIHLWNNIICNKLCSSNHHSISICFHSILFINIFIFCLVWQLIDKWNRLLSLWSINKGTQYRCMKDKGYINEKI